MQGEEPEWGESDKYEAENEEGQDSGAGQQEVQHQAGDGQKQVG